MKMLICIKQHLSNTWRSIHEEVKQHWGCVKKALLIKKRVAVVVKTKKNQEKNVTF